MGSEKDGTLTVDRDQKYIVALKSKDQTYFLVDLYFTISMDQHSAMIFLNENHALEYATKAENYLSESKPSHLVGAVIKI